MIYYLEKLPERYVQYLQEICLFLTEKYMQLYIILHIQFFIRVVICTQYELKHVIYLLFHNFSACTNILYYHQFKNLMERIIVRKYNLYYILFRNVYIIITLKLLKSQAS